MLPEFKYILFAFFIVIFGTKNGRAILLEYCIASVFWIPFSIRRRIFLQVLNLSLTLTKPMLDFVTTPYGKQIAWIKKKETSLFTAHWIGSDLRSQSIETIEKEAANVDLIIMYIHGGGFTCGNSRMYMPTYMYLINQIKKRFGLTSLILSVDYPLTPYPNAQTACIEVYRYLLHDLGIAPCKIILAGDSAGGNLVTTTLLSVRDQRTCEQLKSLPPLPLPAGAVTISPWLTLCFDSPTYKSNHGYDILTEKQLIKHLFEFIPDYNTLINSKEKDSFLKQPMLSPLYASFTDLCPMLVAYSDREIFQYDILQFINNLKRDKVDTSVISRKDEVHVWLVEPTIASSLKIWEEDLNKVADWIIERLH
ncbi:unnamed protein product [Cunninghamella echinulata]